MNKTPLITIIVPIYNTARYLPRCLDSICQQTYKNLEIILVDDGSTDNSLEICNQYAAKDKRIRIFHQENKGVSAARNAGLEKMTGEFFTFVDGDDWVVAHYVKCLFELARQYHASLSLGGTAEQRDHRNPHFPNKSYAQGILAKQDAFLASPYQTTVNIASKLYRKSDLTDLRFHSQHALGEDALFFFEALQRAQTVAATDEPLYVYCRRSGSATGAISVQTRYHYFLLWQQFSQKTEQLSAKALSLARDNAFGAAVTLSMSIILVGTDPRYPQARQEALSFIRKNKKHLWKNNFMGTPGKLFTTLFVCFPTLVTGFCRLPGIKQLLLKIAPKRFA